MVKIIEVHPGELRLVVRGTEDEMGRVKRIFEMACEVANLKLELTKDNG